MAGTDRVTENQQKLQALLRDLFQFDAADLDFGIYRVLNQRRDIIEEFIEEDLIGTVHEALETIATEERAELQEEVDEARQEVIENLSEDVFTPEGEIQEEYLELGAAEDYVEAKERLEKYEVAEETEARIFNDLHMFFSRFYDRGDFHAQRRFASQDAKFMVPYNGEEVFFHWANRDQYYVKTSEHFTTYRFDAADLTVEFTIEDANVPQDNLKGDERYFILGTDPISWDEDERTLTVGFQYRLITEDEAQEFVEIYNDVTGDDRSSFNHKTNTILCTALSRQILDRLDASVPLEALQQEDDGETVLMQHLSRYTSENTMDYFVHKDLGGFLRDELDYYIQNEILETHELVEAGVDREPQSLLRARVVRKIADRIITFLHQIEDFQKRLFEKRKFVTQTDYMVTLDKIPDQLYDDVLANNDQLEQWHDVYNTDEWEGDLWWQGEFTEDVLDDNQHLMVDTALFDSEFKHQLLASFDDIEVATDGTLIHGENFQALNLLSRYLKNEVKCIYIDPPYNTGNDDFIYKDSYQHSSWLSLMSDRLAHAKETLKEDGVIFSSIDDREFHRLTSLMNGIFGEKNHIASFVWKRRTSTAMRGEPISPDHEYALMYSKSRDSSLLYGLPPDPEDYPYEDEHGRYASTDLTVGMNKDQRPGQFYPITNPRTGETYEPNPDRVWRFYPDTMEEKIEKDRIIWPDEEGGQMTRPRYKTYYDPEELEPKPVSTWIEEASTDNEMIENVETEYVTSLLQANRNEEGGRDLSSILPGIQSYYPKPVSLIKSFVRASTRGEDTVLDFFAGSGTTAQAVMELNQEDGGNRDYFLVEVGEYFETVLRPRIQKLALTFDWEDGVPQNYDGQSHMVKDHRIESYEDALNNVRLEEPEDEGQRRLVEDQRSEYVSGYLLDFEAEGPSLMEPVSFEHPFDFELKIERNRTNRRPVSIDLVETFHYLLGAETRRFKIQEHQDRKYVVTKCSVEIDNAVDSVLTVWRDSDDLDLEEERDWFVEQFEPGQFDRIYINTESYVPSAEPVEVAFKSRMEAGYDGAE